MNKKIAIGVALVTAVLAAAQYTHMLMCEVALFEEYPDIDPKIVVKAHRKMVRRAYMGAYNDIELTDENSARIFLAIVEELKK